MSLTHLGSAQVAVGQMSEAETTLAWALEAGRDLGRGDERIHATAAEALALLMRQLYRYDDSERLFLEALDVRQRAADSDSPGLARLQHEYGILLREAGRFEEARTLHEKSLEERRGYFGYRHPEVAASLEELATVERFIGRFARAEALYRESLALRLSIHGKRHKEVADVKNALALALASWGRTEEAVTLLREVVDLNEELSGKSTEWATMASNLAVQLTDRGQYQEAEALFSEALAVRIRDLGDQHPLVGQTILTLGRLYRGQGRLDRAEVFFTRAAVFGESLPSGHRARAYPALALASLLIERGEGSEAEAILRPALVELAKSHPSGHWRIAMADASLGRALQKQGNLEQAEQLLLQALASLEAAESDDPERRQQVRGWLAELYGSWGKPDKAKVYTDN